MIRQIILGFVIGITILAVLAGLFYASVMGYFVRQPTPEQIADDIVALINLEREAQGLAPLVINEHLTLMAQWRSKDMLAGGYQSHEPPEGHPTLEDFTVLLGYDSMYAPVENIVSMYLVFGQRLDEVYWRAVDGWRASPGHWGWAMSEETTTTGVGVAVGDGYVVITQLFWGTGLFSPSAARKYNCDAPQLHAWKGD